MKRVEWIDGLKGYAICIMMFSHMEFAPRVLKNFISPLMMLGFFLSAGYTFHARGSFKMFFFRKCQTLLWPWFVFASFNILLTQILTFSEHAPLKEQFIYLLLQIRGEEDGLWFFPCMFMVTNLFFLLDVFLKPRWLFWLIQPILLAADMIYSLNGGPDLPWHVQMWGAGCFSMALGYFFRTYQDRFAFLTKKSTLALLTFLLLASGVCNEYFYPDNHVNFYDYGVSVPVYFILTFVCAFFWFSFIQQAPSPRIIQYAGRNSLMYFAFHGKPKRLFTVVLTRLGLVPDIHPAVNLLLAVIELFILLYLLVLPCEIIHRFFPFLLGQAKAPKKK